MDLTRPREGGRQGKSVCPPRRPQASYTIPGGSYSSGLYDALPSSSSCDVSIRSVFASYFLVGFVFAGGVCYFFHQYTYVNAIDLPRPLIRTPRVRCRRRIGMRLSGVPALSLGTSGVRLQGHSTTVNEPGPSPARKVGVHRRSGSLWGRDRFVVGGEVSRECPTRRVWVPRGRGGT